MKNQRKRLLALVAMVLACIMVLPVFSGCAKEEKAPTTTAEEAFKEENDTAVPSTTTKVPVATKSNPNAESLQSTPNKGGNTKVTSGTTSVKSKYSAEQEALLNKELKTTATPQERRDYAEAYMRAMQTNLWILQDRPDTQVSTASGEKTYYLHDYADEASWKAAFEGKDLKTPDNYDYKVADGKTYSFQLRSGVTYRGLPFSRAAAGLENFNLFVKSRDEQGVGLVDTRFDTYYLYGAPGIIGNTPLAALTYAWNTVSYTTYSADGNSTLTPQNGYCFVEGLKFPEMDPEDLEALQKPSIPDPSGKLVGSVILQKLSPTLQDASLDNDTDDIVAFNGEQGMYAAYANLQKADGVIRNDGSNADDSKMIVTVNVVKNPNGEINGDESYVTVLAQTTKIVDLKDADGNPVLDAKGNQIRTFSEVDAKYSFKELFDGNYIPVTVPELLYQSVDDGGASVRDPNEAYAARKTASYLYTGVLGASRRVLWVNAVLTDKAGNVVFDNLCFAERGDVKTYTKGATTEPGRYIFDMAKLDDSQEKVVSLGDDVVAGSKLEPGDYHYKITARMITGEELVAREFDFTVEPPEDK